MRFRNLHLLALAVVALALAVPPAVFAATPAATTGPATNVTSTTATVSGSVNPNKVSTTYHFEYGTTTAYGTSTPDQPASGNKAKTVTADLAQLAPSTTYHYRIVAVFAGGTSTGTDMTFTTLAAGQAPPGGNAITAAAAPASVTFGRGTTISGQVTGDGNAGVQVTLQQLPLPLATGSAFTDVATATTDGAGNYSFVGIAPAQNTRYQVVAKTKPPVTSPVVQVNVRFAVTFKLSDSTPRRGARVRFSGVSKPTNDGGTVLIQRRARTGKFRTVTRTVLRTSKTAGQSRYSKRVRIKRSGVWRVRVLHDASHTTGTSRKRRIRVH